MHSSDPNQSLPARRKVLSGMVSAAALLGLNAATAAASPSSSANPSAPEAPEAFPEELIAQARLRNYKSRRSSSWDRTGANADAVPVEPGASATLLDVSGAGVITHVWFTISSDDPHHLKNLVLRAWWDGESTPSVEVPIGDFYGMGLGEYFTYQSALLAVAPIKALNAYFQMPFEKSARLTLTNEGPVRTDSLYFAVDYVTLPSLPSGIARFHAQYRQAAPNKGWTDNWKSNGDDLVNNKKNLDGKDNYVWLEASGRGHYVGVTMSVLQNQDGWWGEGDDVFFVDGAQTPSIQGTGSEDYFLGAWDFGTTSFSYASFGAPQKGAEEAGSRSSVYRFHLDSPIPFARSLRATIEHGHANSRSDNFYSVAYWYQTEPHAAFPPLPPVAERIPVLHPVRTR